MNQIKKFIDKVSASESKRSQTVILTLEEARFLRDELAKLLLDLQIQRKEAPEPTFDVVVTGGSFKNV